MNGARSIWASRTLPANKIAGAVAHGKAQISQGLITFPVAKSAFGVPPTTTGADFIQAAHDRRITYTAFLRATSGGRLRKSIKTSDLLCSQDGKPISYSLNGVAIVIDTRGALPPFVLPRTPTH